MGVSDKAAEILMMKTVRSQGFLKPFGITDGDVKMPCRGETAEKIKQNIITNVVKPPPMSLIKTVMTLFACHHIF